MSSNATHTPLAQRVASLSDSVFGVGMTLLAYDVAFPKNGGVHDTFVALRPQLYGLALSFGIAGVYWLNQQRRLAVRHGEPGAALVLDFVLLFAIILLPISTRTFVLANASHAANEGTAAVFYSGNLCVLACINAASWIAIPAETSLEGIGVHYDKILSSVAAGMFLVSFGISFQHPSEAQWIWWSTFIAPVLRAVFVRRARSALIRGSQGATTTP